MSLLPQIDNEMNSNIRNEVTIPSKTYKLNQNLSALDIDYGEPKSVEGSELYITDNVDGKEINGLKVIGNSTQETRSGKNKWHENQCPKTQVGVTVTHDKVTDEYIINGTATANNNIYLLSPYNTNLFQLEANEKYSCTVTKVSGSATGNITIASQARDNNDGLFNIMDVVLGNADTQKSKSYTVSAPAYIRYANVLVTDGVTYDNLRLKIQVEKGEPTDFEKHGVSPSPDFPSEIQTITGEQSVTVCGENLFNVDNASDGYQTTLTQIENGIKATGPWYVKSELLTLKPNTIYSLSYITTNIVGELKRVLIYKQDGSTAVAQFTNGTGGSFITAADTQYYIYFYSGYGSDGEVEFTFIQLKEGSTPKPYKPYQGQTYNFTLAEEYCSLPNGVKDTIEKIGGVWKRCQKIGKLVLNGTEGWQLYSGYTGEGKCYQLENSLFALGSSTSICTHFKNVYSAYQPNIGYIGAYSDHTSVHRKYFISDKATTEEFKTWLTEQYNAETPVIVYYELATPIYTDIEDTALLEFLNNFELLVEENNISVISENLPAILNIEYFSYDTMNLNYKEVDRIIGYADDLEAVKQSIYHILNIERYAYLIYDDNYGVELEQYIGKDLDYIKSTIETTLYEALTYDLRINNVIVNNIEQKSINSVLINFTVDTIYGDLVMEVSIDV